MKRKDPVQVSKLKNAPHRWGRVEQPDRHRTIAAVDAVFQRDQRSKASTIDVPGFREIDVDVLYSGGQGAAKR